MPNLIEPNQAAASQSFTAVSSDVIVVAECACCYLLPQRTCEHTYVPWRWLRSSSKTGVGPKEYCKQALLVSPQKPFSKRTLGSFLAALLLYFLNQLILTFLWLFFPAELSCWQEDASFSTASAATRVASCKLVSGC